MVKIIGLYIDRHLTFVDHVDHVVDKCNGNLMALVVALFICNMVRIFKRGESRVTFCTVKCRFPHKRARMYFYGTVKRRTVKRRRIV